MDVFQAPENFDRVFKQNLTAILAQQSLGAFLLTCANAYSQQALLKSMQDAVDAQYQQLQGLFQGGQLGIGSAEDQRVFQSLLDLGLDNLPVTERRQLGPWSVQYNTMRGFRPLRHASKAPVGLHVPFKPDDFHFNKPFISKELFWQGEFQGHGLAAYYNKFPFADYHLLWVPDREQEHSQYQQQTYHHLIWALVDELSSALPGFAVGFSSMGGCASVNHLHFQSYLGDRLSVERNCWRHNGGDEAYPLSVSVFHRPEDAWLLIQQFHAQNQPYNLLYTRDKIYCLPRLRQGSIQLPEWSPGFAWREVCGEMLSVKREDYLCLSQQDIEACLAQWRVDL